MIYLGLRFLMQVVLRIFFRKVFFAQRNLTPQNQPIILACNHPNSFLDAVLLAVLIPRPLHFLARSDVFNTPFKKWLLGKMHLIPIYRLEEGKENLQNNDATFNHCYQILAQNGAILIFSEGNCVIEKKLRPLRKGTARLALGAWSKMKPGQDLQVVPISLNYTDPTHFRREVMLAVSKPIQVVDFSEKFQVNPAAAIRQLTDCIRESLLQNLVVISNPTVEALTEKILNRNRLNQREFWSLPWYSNSSRLLKQEIQIARQVDLGMNYPNVPVNNRSFLLKWVLICLTFLVFLIGFILNIWPLYLAQIITGKKVKLREFRASVLMTLGMVFYLMYWFLIVVFLIIAYGSQGLVISFLIPVSGYLALKWWDYYRLVKQINQLSLRIDPVESQGLEHPIR